MSVATTPQRRWLTQAEAGDYLGCTDRTIRNYIRRGSLPARRLGTRSVRVSVEDLEKLLRPIPTVGSDHG